ncbi:MAG: Mrp/NBP35 family ATP-binding protein [Clostridiales bacterium]|nr:Mrp/NBP35 family ATP-binding protein [Clostridiales bacterium]
MIFLSDFENCTHDCSSCGEQCPSRNAGPADFLEQPHPQSMIRKVIGVVSGKGGVGKSMVSALMAVSLNRLGYRTAILDADVTGPSIPKMFGLRQKAGVTDSALLPVRTKTGIDIMSVNLLLENETSPVIWRGPVIAGVVRQFWTDVIWEDVDFLFVDMPPGTGDVPLTIFQSIPVDGIIVVTSPQELVSMIVGKAVNMAKMMDIPLLGIIENMSYALCPDCGKKIPLFGDSRLEKTAEDFGLDILARIPVDPTLARNSDEGLIELFEGDWLEDAVRRIEGMFQ